MANIYIKKTETRSVMGEMSSRLVCEIIGFVNRKL